MKTRAQKWMSNPCAVCGAETGKPCEADCTCEYPVDCDCPTCSVLAAVVVPIERVPVPDSGTEP